MITLKAKYNSANIMIDQLDQTTISQTYGFLNHPAFAKTYIAIMPDCHAGMGAVIGLTMKMNGYVIPNIVGVDIGCGVLTVKLPETLKDIDFDKLDDFIRNNIPHGFHVNSKPACDNGFAIGVTRGGLNVPDIRGVSDNIESDANRNVLALGSLGGGNHFIEIGIDEDDNYWLTVHSGSRKFGLDIATYYQKKAKELMKKMFIGSAYNNLEFLLEESPEGQGYLCDMKFAQHYATVNRKLMALKIYEYLVEEFASYSYRFWEDVEQIESVHNYIDFEDRIIRKGAIRAYKNERLVIPFNMEDGLVIGKGKSSKKWNCSAPHGAGRVLSRKRARAELNLEEYQKSMKDKGVYTNSLNANTLDEAKGAYKDKDIIINSIKETVDIQHFVKPIYNFKADN